MTSQIEKIIAALEASEGPDRRLDQSIAIQVGYVLYVVQDQLGAPDKKVWYFGSPRREVRLPPFTGNIDRAMELANLVAPDHVGALVWDKPGWKAQLNDGPPCVSSTAPIAICLAAMKELLKSHA